MMQDTNMDESKINDEMQENLMTPMNNRSIVDRIITRITNAIISGELLPGQQIPTESELCESMHVSRNSVREAIKALVAMGVLNIRRAEGTFVAEGFSERMLDPMVYGLILEGGNSPAIIELRRLFEVGILKLAIEKATEEDIKRMQEALETLRITIEKHLDKEEILDADIKFHKALEHAVNNPLVDKISVVIERLSRLTRARATEHFIKENEMDDLLGMHKKMLNLIIERDETAVAEVVDEHFKYWKNELK
ncbi:MAG: FadR/GntR family transcriptional regulator [Acetivibrionales bacterium]|jgi:GntR family transcriptional repressor for pyruvate dehydrogenase complex